MNTNGEKQTATTLLPRCGALDPSQRYRPTCPMALANEARRLAAQGLTPHDLAHVLRLTAPAVAELLKEAA